MILPVLLPDGDLDWARVPRRGVAARRPAAGCSSRTATALGVGRDRRPPTWCWCPGLAVGPDGLRLGRGGGSYDRALARVPVGTFTCVLLLRRRGRPATCPSSRTTAGVAAAATPVGRHPPGRERRACPRRRRRRPPRRERPRQRLARGPEVGLVGVVGVERVARDAGQVDPARLVEVAERDDHPHRRRVGHAVPLGGVPRRRVDGRAAAADLPAAAVDQPLAPARCRTRRASALLAARAGAGGPRSSRRGLSACAPGHLVAGVDHRRGQDVVAGLDRAVGAGVVPPGSAVGSRAGRSTTATQRSPPSGHSSSGRSSWKVAASRWRQTDVEVRRGAAVGVLVEVPVRAAAAGRRCSSRRGSSHVEQVRRQHRRDRAAGRRAGGRAISSTDSSPSCSSRSRIRCER